ncbi:MAG: sulfatase-like hydrolase/transferase [bacterium]
MSSRRSISCAGGFQRTLCVAFVALVVFTSCTRPRAAPPDIVVIVVDTLRADRLGAYGNARGLTPFLDQFARRATRFTNAYAASSWTVPSVASLFTARYPSQHLVNTFDTKLVDSEVTLAERLTAQGYATGGVTANLRLTAPLGFGQGFAYWQPLLGSVGSPSKARGRLVRARALAWLDGDGKPPPRPRFLYLQFMEPHPPFEPPAALRARFAPDPHGIDAAEANRQVLSGDFTDVDEAQVRYLAQLYDAEVAAVDAELRTLFDALQARGALDNAVVVITADHGEEFREHGGLAHGLTLYNEVVHVPLLIAGPGIAAGRVIDMPVSLVDVAPTLLAIAGAAPEPRFEGRSLLPWLRADGAAAPQSSDVLLQLLPDGSLVDLHRHRAGLVRQSAKVLVPLSGDLQHYDLATDPGEQQPNSDAARTSAAGLGDALQAATQRLAAHAQDAPARAPVDAATRERLRALGYQH